MLTSECIAEAASWDLRVPQNIPAVAIPVNVGQGISGSAMNVVKEAVGEVKPGLLHHWYDINNPGSIEGVAEFYDINAEPVDEPAIAAFNPENTWWTGNQAPLEGGTTEAPKYPIEVIDQPRPNAGGTFSDSDNNNYTVGLSGELRFPRDGEYLFTDGVDDLTVFAVDVNRDGEFDEDEVLINDNAWTSLNRDSNDGGFPNEYVPSTVDVPEDGNCVMTLRTHRRCAGTRSKLSSVKVAVRTLVSSTGTRTRKSNSQQRMVKAVLSRTKTFLNWQYPKVTCVPLVVL